MPLAFSPRSTANSRSLWRWSSAELGSSRMSSLGFSRSARAIATSCRSPGPRSPSGAWTSTSRPSWRSRSRLRASISRREISPLWTGSRLTNRLASTGRSGNSPGCCRTTPMPSFRAALGLSIVAVLPSNSMTPRSGRTMPASTFVSVDLPAPLSPTSAWIEPRSTTRFMSSSTTVPPKRLAMVRTNRIGESDIGTAPRPHRDLEADCVRRHWDSA